VTADLVSVYPNALTSAPIRTVPWQHILDEIGNGTHAALIAQARSIRAQGPDQYREFKKRLPAVTFAGTFNGKRSTSSVLTTTGFLIPDLDHLPNVDATMNLLRQDEKVWFGFRSPGGDGLKIGIRAQEIKNDNDHKRFFAQAADYFQQVYGLKIDPACKDISRLTFLSHDPTAWINPAPYYFEHEEQQDRPEFEAGMSKTKYAQKVLTTACSKIAAAQPGSQHATRYSQARLVGGFLHLGLPEATALSALEAAVVRSGAENVAAAMKTVRDGLRDGQAAPLEPPPLRGQTYDPRAPWPDPQPLPGASASAVLPFDPDLLPDEIRDWVTDEAERIGCAPDFVAVGAMVSLSALVGCKVGIRPKIFDDWHVVPNLWGQVVGRPSSKKTPGLSAAMKPLARLEAQKAEAHKEKLQEWLTKLETNKIFNEAIKSQAKQEAKDLLSAGKPPDVTEILKGQRETEKAPVQARIKINDCTEAKLGELLSQTDRGLLLFRDELNGWLASLENPQNKGLREFYLEAWDGTNSYAVDRINRGSIFIQHHCLSILGGIQPGPLERYVAATCQGGAGDDGLLQRFQLLVWPEMPESNGEDRAPDTEARERAFDVFQRLDELDVAAIGTADTFHSEKRYLRFDREAGEVFRSWLNALLDRLRSGELDPAMESHFAKYPSLVPSLALIDHLVDHPHAQAVGLVSLRRAMAWADYLSSHAFKVYTAARTPMTTAAHILARKIQDGAVKSPFTCRDVYVHGWQGLDRESTEMAADNLAGLDWLREEIISRPGPGRPKTVYHINPVIMEEGKND